MLRAVENTNWFTTRSGGSPVSKGQARRLQARRPALGLQPNEAAWGRIKSMSCARRSHAAVTVPGGMLVVGGFTKDSPSHLPAELYDETTDRWFTLPHELLTPLDGDEKMFATHAVVLPAAVVTHAE